MLAIAQSRCAAVHTDIGQTRRVERHTTQSGKLHLCLGGGSPRMVVVPCGDSEQKKMPCGPSRTSPRRWPRPHMDNAWLLSECCLSCSTRIHWLPRSCSEFGRRGTVPARLASLHRVNAIPTLKNSVSQDPGEPACQRPRPKAIARPKACVVHG